MRSWPTMSSWPNPHLQTPPAQSRWLVVHLTLGVQREVLADSAYLAAQAAGWALSECQVEQVRS